MINKKPRILLYDIENTPTVVTTWGLWEQNAIETLEEWYLLSYAYKWLGEDTVHVVALPDFKGYSKDKKNDKALCESLHKLFDEADIVVAHNGNSHDQPKSNARFIYHGLTPPSPYKQIDTKNIAKKYFKFNSNSLNNLGTYLKLGNKIENGGIALWRACMDGDMKSWSTMKKYNKQDVVLLEKVYEKLTPWMFKFPVVPQSHDECPRCQSKRFQSRGKWMYAVGAYKKLQCKDCGHWFKGEKIIVDK
jgi:hypothetical protein